jgi:hypothetical protein
MQHSVSTIVQIHVQGSGLALINPPRHSSFALAETDPIRIADKTKPCPVVAWTPSIR